MAPPKDQDAILAQFREQLTQEDLIHEGDSIGTDDRTLLRFLRARQYNLKAAKQMWKNCVEWRNTVEGVGIDELYRKIDPWDYPERDHVFNCWPLWFHKTDKKGRPLNIHFFGGINMPNLYKHISPERHWQTVLVNCESLTREVLPATSKAMGRPVEGTFVIVDLKGFGLSQFWQMKNLARQSFQVSQDYFPETMAQLAIVNAPSSFTTIWSFIKPWLAKETVAKVDILGSDYQKVLLNLIDAENLPSSLGGQCTCSEHGGCDQSNAGPWSEGRKERREKWLKGEGDIVSSDQDVMKEHVPGADDARTEDDEVDSNGSALTDSSSTNSTSEAPSTPPSGDQLAEQFANTSIHEITIASSTSEPHPHLSPEESLKKVVEEHPETRQVQTGGLYANA